MNIKQLEEQYKALEADHIQKFFKAGVIPCKPPKSKIGFEGGYISSIKKLREVRDQLTELAGWPRVMWPTF